MQSPPEASVVASVLRGDKITTEELARFDATRLVTLLQKHGVAVLFRARLREIPDLEIPVALESMLAAIHRSVAMRALVQERALHIVDEALGAADVSWMLWRGMQLGHLLYDDVTHRLGVDIDLLIRGTDRPRVVAALTAAGFSPHILQENVSHEMSLLGHGVGLDLHWQVLRPQRARIDLGAWMMTRLATRDDIAMPDMTATLVMLLLHTAITEHVTGRLIRAVDVDRAVRSGDVDWSSAIAVIRDSGLKTAAWATLVWTRAQLATPIDDKLIDALAPGPLRSRYLTAWLARDPATTHKRAPTLVRAGFSLALQDDMRGVARALTGLAQSRFAK